MAEAIEEKKIAYLKSSNFLRRWSERQCEVCEVDGIELSMTRAPPPLLHALPVEPVPERPAKEVPLPKKKVPEDKYLNVFNAALKAANAAVDFSDWLKRPATPSLRGTSKEAKVLPRAHPPRMVPPFDIQDVPKAMRKLHMPMAAKLQERWFAGQENYSLNADDLQKEIDQRGIQYTGSFVDSTTIKMDWVLSFPRAKKAFDKLVHEQLYNAKSVEILKNKLAPYRNRNDIVAWNLAKSDFFQFHQKFQFQLLSVNATWASRISQFLERQVSAGGIPDDLTGALGSFNFYVAVRYANFDHSRKLAIVSDVSIYVRDPYEFSDDQYLGHWSASHVAVVPAHQIAAVSKWIDSPIVDGNIFEEGRILYPVKNEDYRRWRRKNNRGGDFMIYSDRMNVRLDPPIFVVL